MVHQPYYQTLSALISNNYCRFITTQNFFKIWNLPIAQTSDPQPSFYSSKIRLIKPASTLA